MHGGALRQARFAGLAPNFSPWMAMNPRTRLATILLVALGLGSTVTNLANRYSQDDMAVIEKNPVIHSLSEPITFFTQSYWPKPFPPALYRPLATSSFAL